MAAVSANVPAAPLSSDAEPFAVHAMPVSHGHVLHVAEYGLRNGLPAVVIHGGPGSRSSPVLRAGFDPLRWRVVCIDQRGSGLSRPRGSIEHNTTAHLLEDMRAVRTHLGIEAPWLVAGGSWGATLAILHALDAPDAVAGLLLRASFLARPADIDGFLRPLGRIGDIARIFATGTPDAQQALARTWWAHEYRLSHGVEADAPLDGEALAAQVDRYRVQSHYLLHGCWLGDPPLAERCANLPRVPTLLLHGDADRICPPESAQVLRRAIPHARLRWISGAGHDPTHPAMLAATAEGLARFASQGSFDAPDGSVDGPAPR